MKLFIFASFFLAAISSMLNGMERAAVNEELTEEVAYKRGIDSASLITDAYLKVLNGSDENQIKEAGEAMMRLFQDPAQKDIPKDLVKVSLKKAYARGRYDAFTASDFEERFTNAGMPQGMIEMIRPLYSSYAWQAKFQLDTMIDFEEDRRVFETTKAQVSSQSGNCAIL